MRVYCDESPPRIRHGRSEYLRVKEHQNPVRQDFFPKSADSCPSHRLFPLPLTASPSSLLPRTGLTLPPPRGSQPQALFGIQQGSASNWKPAGPISPRLRYSVLPLCLVALFSPVTAASVCRELVRTGPLCDSVLPSIGHPQMSLLNTGTEEAMHGTLQQACVQHRAFKVQKGSIFQQEILLSLMKRAHGSYSSFSTKLRPQRLAVRKACSWAATLPNHIETQEKQVFQVKQKCF